MLLLLLTPIYTTPSVLRPFRKSNTWKESRIGHHLVSSQSSILCMMMSIYKQTPPPTLYHSSGRGRVGNGMFLEVCLAGLPSLLSASSISSPTPHLSTFRTSSVRVSIVSTFSTKRMTSQAERWSCGAILQEIVFSPCPFSRRVKDGPLGQSPARSSKDKYCESSPNRRQTFVRCYSRHQHEWGSAETEEKTGGWRHR